MENTKLRLWAKQIEKGHYDDLDNPPQIPLITGSPASAKKKTDNISTALVDAATVVAKAFQTSHTSRVSDQLSDGLTFGRLFQANENFSTFRSCAKL